MTRRIVQAIRHVGFEDLGFAVPYRGRGYDIECIDVAERPPATLDLLGADLLVVLGGSISVYDHHAYPIVRDEIGLLRSRLADRMFSAPNSTRKSWRAVRALASGPCE